MTVNRHLVLQTLTVALSSLAHLERKDVLEMKRENAEPIVVVSVVEKETHQAPRKKSYAEQRIKARNTSMERKTRK